MIDQHPNPRRAVGERNRATILDAAASLVRRGEHLHFTVLAREAGLSRPTVYAHFQDRGQLVAALLDRSVRQAGSVIREAQPGDGDAVDALRRVIEAGWEHLAQHEEIARAVAHEVSHDSLHRAHDEISAALGTLLQRGRREGSFRTDLPVEWMVAACTALIHAAALTTRSGRMDPDSALDALLTTVTELCTGTPARPASRTDGRG